MLTPIVKFGKSEFKDHCQASFMEIIIDDDAKDGRPERSDFYVVFTMMADQGDLTFMYFLP